MTAHLLLEAGTASGQRQIHDIFDWPTAPRSGECSASLSFSNRVLSIEILSASILEMRPHPRLTGRVKAVVRVHLKEVVGGLPAEHSIDLRLLVVVGPGDHAQRVQELILAKTAKVLRRVKDALESTSGKNVPPAPAALPVAAGRAEPSAPEQPDDRGDCGALRAAAGGSGEHGAAPG